MTTNKMPELKPCPFCGSLARLAKLENGRECAYCPNEDCDVQPELKGYLDPVNAAAAWNACAAVKDDKDAQIEKLAGALEEICVYVVDWTRDLNSQIHKLQFVAEQALAQHEAEGE